MRTTENNHEYPEGVDIRNDNAILISPTIFKKMTVEYKIIHERLTT
jgi:hypothetical protein